ncbi:MAG: phosphohistidine phosphatase SixA [Anaerolineae bacterium]|nr:phosphohistidine phosphatase SixA [Anaerolineae bacterium]
MKLYFMRHGEASQDAATDELRPLTEKGAQRVHSGGQALAKIQVTLDYIYASPRVRAQQTAAIMAGYFKPAVETRPELNFDFSLDLLRRLLLDKDEEAHVLLVGHNPSMSEVVQAVSGAAVNMKVGSIARVDLYPPAVKGGLLKWLLSPRVLDAMAGA